MLPGNAAGQCCRVMLPGNAAGQCCRFKKRHYLNQGGLTGEPANENFHSILCHLKAELFGPGHFVGLGLDRLRLKSEIRTRT
jgi:hypothetical protein